ncbi:hypothetical protein EE612_040313 [Oryza sativa]|nr:hypothetical protein EE612_040313 [Oryza sativa]
MRRPKNKYGFVTAVLSSATPPPGLRPRHGVRLGHAAGAARREAPGVRRRRVLRPRRARRRGSPVRRRRPLHRAALGGGALRGRALPAGSPPASRRSRPASSSTASAWAWRS